MHTAKRISVRCFSFGEFYPNRNLYAAGGHKYNTRFKDFWQQFQTYGREAQEHTYTRTQKDYKIHRPWDTATFWFKINFGQFWDLFTYRYLRTMNPFTMAVLPTATVTFAYLGAAVWSPFYAWSMLSGASLFYRVREKAAAPEVDELEIKDVLYGNEIVKKYFHDQTSYVIDIHQEYDKFNIKDHVEYNTAFAKFLNVDCNTTTGYIKMCDVQTDARMTVHFKTMPWSDQKFFCTHPFLLVDLWAEITSNGHYHKVQFIEPAKVNKQIFVMSWDLDYLKY